MRFLRKWLQSMLATVALLSAIGVFVGLVWSFIRLFETGHWLIASVGIFLGGTAFLGLILPPPFDEDWDRERP